MAQKLQKVTAYVVGGETLTNRAEARVAQARQNLNEILVDNCNFPADQIWGDFEEDIIDWLLVNAKEVRDNLTAYLKYSAVEQAKE